MRIRFADEMGAELGDREMPEAPLLGDGVHLRVLDRAARSMQVVRFKVVRRYWTPDYPSGPDSISIIILLERCA